MKPTRPGIAVSASLICADLCNIERDLQRLEAVGIDYLHVDLIDAHFSPSLPMGIEVVQQARKKTRLPFDVHLMVENNEFFIGEMAKIGVERLCFHQESAFHVDRTLALIREAGIQAGMALMPATPLSVLEYCIDRLDFVLLMLINPGFAGHSGETQVPYALRRVADCRRFLDERGLRIPIEVDGRVSFASIPGLVAAGASELVVGSSSAFHPQAAVEANMVRVREAIALGITMKTS